MDCLACFDLKAIFEVFLSIFGKNTKKKQKSQKFHEETKTIFFLFFHEISNIFVFLVFFPKMLRNSSKMAFKSKQAKQSIS